MKIDRRQGKPAETEFRVLATTPASALIEAWPFTGRTHQIRLHLAESRLPVLGDPLYGRTREEAGIPLALRAVGLAYQDPFARRRVRIQAPVQEFLAEFGFADWHEPAVDEHF